MIHEGFYDEVIRDIRTACTKGLAELGLTWRFNVSFPTVNLLKGRAEWWVDFFDEYGKPVACIEFFRPPDADERWYTEEIIKQIKAQLVTI